MPVPQQIPSGIWEECHQGLKPCLSLKNEAPDELYEQRYTVKKINYAWKRLFQSPHTNRHTFAPLEFFLGQFLDDLHLPLAFFKQTGGFFQPVLVDIHLCFGRLDLFVAICNRQCCFTMLNMDYEKKVKSLSTIILNSADDLKNFLQTYNEQCHLHIMQW